MNSKSRVLFKYFECFVCTYMTQKKQQKRLSILQANHPKVNLSVCIDTKIKGKTVFQFLQIQNNILFLQLLKSTRKLQMVLKNQNQLIWEMIELRDFITIF